MFGTIELRRVANKTASVILAIVFLFGAASVSFAGDLAGCWKGCWRSDCTGHDGKLRATITQVDDTHYCKDLGPLMGTFSFDGSVTGDEFRATYTSSRDRGEFNMTRIPPCGCYR